MHRRLLVLIATIYSCYGLTNNLENTRFRHISTQQGLSQKTVQSIYQDSHGFMWLGTQEGLNRYDGRNIKVYRHLQKSGISHDVIRAIQEDSDGNLWVATRGGLNRYDAKLDSFVKVKVYDDDKEVLQFNSLYKGKDGTLWIGTDGHGLYSIESKSDEVKKFKVIKKLNTAEVRVVYEDTRGRLWIGTNNQGVFLYENILKAHFVNSDKKSSLSHNSIRSIAEDSKGKIWIGTRGGGINRYNELTQNFNIDRHNPSNPNSLSHDRVYNILPDNNRVWVATDGGISVYNQEQGHYTQITQKSSQTTGLNHNRVLSAFKDKAGLVWFGTMSGINIWNPVTAVFNYYRHIPEDEKTLKNNTVYSFEQLSNSKVAIGTFGSGINILNTKTQDISTVLELSREDNRAKRIMSLFLDRSGELWAGSISSGVEVYSEDLSLIDKYVYKDHGESSLSANGVTDIIQDADGEIWISTYRSGLNRLDKKNNSFKKYNKNNNTSGLESENIFSLLEDEEGFIWLATDGGGISRLDKRNDEIITIKNQEGNLESLSGNIASSIYEDSKGIIWIGTFGNGLNRWSPADRRNLNNNFKKYDISNGLNSSTINGVVEDSSGFIWISTVKGVSKLNPNTDEIVNYDLADEIHDNELNQGAILKDSEGRLYFGGLNGVIAFNPNEVQRNQHIPPVKLTKVTIGNVLHQPEVSISNLEDLELSHKDYLVTLEFSALDYANPSDNQYKYKLEGFDESWINANNLGQATFTNLPSGQYIFKVKGSNNDGVWSDESINLKVTVHPAPWFSWWAYSLYATLFCIILLIFIRHQAKRFAKHDLFQNQVNEKVDEKIQLYMQNNETLTKKVEKLDALSLVDHETQLLSQSAFISQVSTALDVQNALVTEDNRNESRLLIGLLDVDIDVKENNNPAQCLIKVVQQLKQNSKTNMVVARWDTHQLALLMPLGRERHLNNDESNSFVNNPSDSMASVMKSNLDNLITCLSHSENLKSMTLNLGVTLPRYALDSEHTDAELLLLLTEHLMYSAKQYSEKQFSESTYLAVYETRQKLTSKLIKTVISEKSPLKLTDSFQFLSNIDNEI
ncbi:two-component regulator propeller domain-containing protein [Pleionea mediterranea]|uniref:two-component regulator propeller domain-containing protein n=1 Tax=Pleionea mediterranea TaxID=523701 RepID=UPI0014732335|nr:two-component regulator propeller domain-containing protein [Pleionea mediterranea]